jgi:phage minor structural protein|nr:MAG TPA: tail protein [Caudoviricetes sp.]
MIPILYKEDATDFSTYGIGVLADTISCLVTEERNGAYELTLKYPINGSLYDEIKKERIIKAKPNDLSDPQAFRIYRITIPINGIITIYAEHISYDLINIGVIPFSLINVAPQMAIDTLLKSTVLPHNFTFRTDYDVAKDFEVKKPQSVRACLGGTQGSLLNKWGGEFEWDNFSIIHHKGRGNNKGVVIEYGKNLTKLDHDSDISEVYTDILPYAVISSGDGNDVVCTLSEQILPITSTLAKRKTLIKDMTDSFDSNEEITEEKLREKTLKYISDNPLGVENPTITISFEPLWKQPEYSALLERVSLCDTVTVKHTEIGVSVKTKVIKTTYNTLLEKYTSITLGSARSNFVKQVQSIESKIESTKTEVDRFPSLLNYAISTATKLITGNSGGYVILHSAAKDGKPYELLVMDKPNINDAIKVWRWNVNGLGFSNNGYNGPYETAITADGQIVADFITSGTLMANIIKAGIISSKDGSSYWNIDTGEVVLKAYATNEDFDGKVDEIDKRESKIESNINGLTSTVSSIGKRVDGAEDDISSLDSDVTTLAQRADAIELKANSNEKNISSLTVASNKLALKVASNASDISDLEQTADSISAVVSKKADSEGGVSSSFGYKLKSTGFELYSNNKTVMKVNSAGLEINGKITSSEGEIGGLTITESGLSYSGNWNAAFRIGDLSTDPRMPTYAIFSRTQRIDNCIIGFKNNSYGENFWAEFRPEGYCTFMSSDRDDAIMTGKIPYLFLKDICWLHSPLGSSYEGSTATCPQIIVFNYTVAKSSYSTIDLDVYGINEIIGASLTEKDTPSTGSNNQWFSIDKKKITIHNTTGGSKTYSVIAIAI